MSKDLLNASDEDIMNMPEPEYDASVEEPQKEEDIPDALEPVVELPVAGSDETEETTDPIEEDGGDNPLGSDDEADLQEEPTKKPEAEELAKGKADKPEAGQETKETQPAAEPVNYEEFYKKVSANFKANGKEIELKSPDEVIALMQMGANYTKKLQALQPHRKMLQTLEKNGLLDEAKLSYLIDLDKKNPEAIKKLLKDSNIDPMDIDTTTDSDYKPVNHSVSDQEYQFNTALDEAISNPVGQQLVVQIHKEWDDRSKDLLWNNPSTLKTLQTQKENGIFDTIHAELERQRMLGKIDASLPFLQAYYNVGQELQAAGKLNAQQPAQTATVQAQETRTPLATRVAPVKAEKNGDQVRAAAPTKTTPRKPVQDFNPLALSDEDFEKSASFSGRL